MNFFCLPFCLLLELIHRCLLKYNVDVYESSLQSCLEFVVLSSKYHNNNYNSYTNDTILILRWCQKNLSFLTLSEQKTGCFNLRWDSSSMSQKKGKTYFRLWLTNVTPLNVPLFIPLSIICQFRQIQLKTSILRTSP